MPSGRLLAQACASWAMGLALALGGAAPARAWTRSELESADAHVHIWPSGQALVALSLELTVRGGWLSRFEVTGLDPGSRLDPDKPPWLLHEDGRKVTPRAQLQPDGTLVLELDRADAPRRGLHRLGVVYFTQLTATDRPSGKRTISWAMPAWRVDLEDVDLWINAPAGARLANRDETALDGSVARLLRTSGERTVLHLHRVQLPRTLAFGVELELPANPAPPRRARVLPRMENGGTPAGAWLGALVVAIAWLKRASVRARCARSGRRPLPLLALPARARVALMFALGLGGAVCYPRSPAVGLTLLAGVVMLALDRRIAGVRDAPPAAVSGRARLEPMYDLFGTTSWLDATTPPGALLLASLYALGLLRVALGGGLGAWLELVLLVTPLWLTATRLHARAATPAGPLAAQHAQAESTSMEAIAEAGTQVKPRAGGDRRAPDRAA